MVRGNLIGGNANSEIGFNKPDKLHYAHRIQNAFLQEGGIVVIGERAIAEQEAVCHVPLYLGFDLHNSNIRSSLNYRIGGAF